LIGFSKRRNRTRTSAPPPTLTRLLGVYACLTTSCTGPTWVGFFAIRIGITPLRCLCPSGLSAGRAPNAKKVLPFEHFPFDRESPDGPTTYARRSLTTRTLSSERRVFRVATHRQKERKARSREEAASFAVAHRIRIEILALLHEGSATVKQLSRELRHTTGTIGHHVEELLLDGSIEVAKTEKVGSVDQYWYIASKLPEYTSKEIAELTEEEQQATFSLILQSIMAESLAALWSGQLLDDPLITLAWNWFPLDEQGRSDLDQEQERSWHRMHEIAAESAGRRCKSGEEAATYLVALMGFRRYRSQGGPAPFIRAGMSGR
jgi:predicted transcriptional regulator